MAYEFRLPDIGEGLTEAEIVSWHVQVGDHVELDGPLVEVETDKAVVEIPSPREGVVLHVGAAAGNVVEVGSILVVIGAVGEEWAPAAAPPAPIVGSISEDAELVSAPPAPSGPAATVQALPVVRKLARELDVDLEQVEGSGPGGRITREDVQAAAAGGSPGDDDGERVRMSRLRRTIAEHMAKSWAEIPHVTTFDDLDANPLLAARRRVANETGHAPPIEAMIVTAVLPVLAELREFNATLDGEDVIYRTRYDIGIAVDTEDGLIVPVVANADGLAFSELVGEVERLTAAAKERTLTPAEVTGGTFTVSNIGAVAGGHGTPIIPFGTTAILSVGRIREQPIVEESAVVVRPLMPVSLSFDHRVIDGALGRRFISELRKALFDWSAVS